MRLSILSAVLSCAVQAADSPLQPVFQRMDQASLSFKGFTANLTKVDHQDFSGVTETSTGTLTVRKSGPRKLQALEKIEIQNGKPDVQEIEVTGAHVVRYMAKDNKGVAYAVSKKYRGVEEALFGIFGGSSKELQQNYQVAYGGSEAVNGQPAARLILTPNDPQLAGMFSKIEVWMSNATGIAIQQKIYERGEMDYHLLTYSDMKLQPISESQVKLNLPKDVTLQRPH